MGDESINLPGESQSIEYHMITLFDKLEALKNDKYYASDIKNNRIPMKVEIRTLELWKSVICECFASFIYIFIVCGAALTGGIENGSISSILLATALASGFTMTTLSQCFGHISGRKLLFANAPIR